jgi:hypothetical protein
MHIIDYQAQFQVVANALDGAGGFYDFTYLIQHPREPDTKYVRRQELAWYDNRLKPACAGFVGYIDKRPATRDTGGNELLAAFVDDCDKCGNSLAVWLSSFMIQAKARGTMFCLVDSPKDKPASAQDQQSKREFAYLVQIKPEHITELQLDDFANVVKIVWTDHIGTGYITRTWDAIGWKTQTDKGGVEEGEHGLGFCPVIAFTESLEVPYVGAFAQIAAMSKRLLNMHSEKDEIERSQTFSILNYVVPPELRSSVKIGDVAASVGTENLLMSYGTSASFIAPADGPLTLYMQDIAAMELRIDEVALKIVDSKNAESGVARDMRFQALNAALVSFATRMEDFERRMWYVVAAWLKIDTKRLVVTWQKNYSLSDVKAEIENAAAVDALGMPDSFKRAQKKRIVSLLLSDTDQDTLDEILNDIDEGEGEVKPSAEPLPGVADDPNQP